ncbi:MAG: lamin tail domain-containing protein, partial [bacterium]|nr:lamin tail domain-containing protein [bacterium]
EPTPEPDTTPPDFVFEVLTRPVTTATIALAWSSSAEDLASYDLDVAMQLFDSDHEGLWSPMLNMTDATSITYFAAQDDATYFFRLRARDTTGNVSEWKTLSADVSQKPIVINEVAWMGTDASFQDEWIELYNKTGAALSLDDWRLRVSTVIIGSKSSDIPLSGSIEPHGYYLMERTDDTTVADISADIMFTGSLNNEYTQLSLVDAAGTVIDETPHGAFWAAGDNATKHTMERVRTELSGNDHYNWFTNNPIIPVTDDGRHDAEGNGIWGTPKAENSVRNLYTSAHGEQFLSGERVWMHDKSPYYIPMVLHINPGASLAIESGVVVKFGINASLMVEGRILADGTEAEPVVFTAFADDAYAGDTNRNATATMPVAAAWRRITMAPAGSGSEFHHAVFRYGGAEIGAAYDRSGILVSVEGTSALFDRVTFEHGYRGGLRLLNSQSHVIDSVFAGPWENMVSVPCDQFGGNAILAQGGSPVMERNTIDNAIRGMFFCGTTPVVRDNTIRNTETPIYASSALGEFRGNHIESSTMNGIFLTGIFTESGTITKDVHPYVIDNVHIFAPGSIAIEPGVVLKFAHSNYAELAVHDGALFAEGTAEEPITFTTLSDDSAGGDTDNNATGSVPFAGAWNAITFSSSSIGRFAHARIRYGGGLRNGLAYTWTAVTADNPTELSFIDSEITDSATHGVMVERAATGTVTFTDTLFARNNAWNRAALQVAGSHVKLERIHFAQNHYGIWGDYESIFDATDLVFDGNYIDIYPEDLLQNTP